MVQKIHAWGVIWVPNFGPHAGNLSDTKMTTKLSSMKMSVDYPAIKYVYKSL